MEVDEVVATVASLVTCHIKVTRQPVPGGTGLSRVQELVPVPVPVRTHDQTRAGYQTRAIHYSTLR